MVGSDREAVTRAMTKMRRTGAVRTRDRTIYVTDEDALWSLAQAVRKGSPNLAPVNLQRGMAGTEKYSVDHVLAKYAPR